jgi:hypothetical protein
MAKDVLRNRVHYRSSGRIGWMFFALVIPVTAGAAILLAALLSLALQAGLYFAAYAACGVAVPLSMIGWWGTRVGHCRNRLIAVLYGVLAGATMYFGYYYIDLAASRGFGEIPPLKALAGHIQFRLRHDRWQKPMQRDPPGPIAEVNLFVFGAELFLVTAIAAIGPFRMSRAVFCEEAGTWAVCHYYALRSGAGSRLHEAVERGGWAIDPIRFKKLPVRVGVPFCEVIVEECPVSEGESNGCVYLSVREIDATGRWRFQHRSDFGYLVRQCQLSPSEVRQLKDRIGEEEWPV